MVSQNHPAWLGAPFFRYLSTAIALCFPVYVYIQTARDFTASRPDLPFSVISFWPLLFLIIPIGLLLISMIVSTKQQRLAGRVAFIATVLAWCYYFLMVCPLLSILALAFFTSPIKLFAFFLPCILLAFTTVYARRASRVATQQ